MLSATAGKLKGSTDSEESRKSIPSWPQAREQLEAGDFDAAKQSYQAILDANPGSVEAKGAIRQIDFLTRATAQRPDAVAVADAAPGDIEAAFAAADVQILNQDVSAAFDRLIALVRSTSGDDRTSVRTRLIELFELFDPADPEVVAGRRNLANALYYRGASPVPATRPRWAAAPAPPTPDDHATGPRWRRHLRGCRSRSRCRSSRRC